MNWDVVIGLEVHIQLKTQSKLFCNSPNEFGGEPNSRAAAVDSGLPGTLPVLNRQAVSMAVRLGLALQAQVNRTSVFVRKNYFYPDLPKNYQISQLQHPIIGPGTLDVELPDGSVSSVRIHHAHLEEDAGKLVHEHFVDRSGVDINRAGVPLIEVVSEPDMHTPEEAMAYMRELHRIVRYLGICGGNMSRGEMRCDANVSIRPSRDAPLGTRTELKNINSFRFIGRAIEVEIARQIGVREAGGSITQQTLLFDPDTDSVRPMRDKDTESDYRYFPDPDLLPVHIDDGWFAQIQSEMPESADAVCARYQDQHGLPEASARQLVIDTHWINYFEQVHQDCGDAAMAANWMLGTLTAALNQAGVDIEHSAVSSAQLGELLRCVREDTISASAAKNVFESLWQQPGAVTERIEELGLTMMSDSGALEAAIAQVLQDNPQQCQQYREGKTKVLGYLVGQVMKITGGKADPRKVSEAVTQQLQQGT